ncbi:MAG: type II toxin-antitoxin system VapC family toxin [Spiribacter salinus]|uniref:Type II toxin-antitoxin system VapC family toxin n=1 Tax=Spiribacter salinus TaxID=1335746 RepID=A0A540VTT9_9GAMM|nr:MAG: type II toxin-antitoxin system VapC family toxin [Spiribacter salinus]
MIGLDTNVLVRFLTQDDPDQSARANALLESRCSSDQPGYVSAVVLCELVWVLRGAYGYQKSLLVHVLEELLGAGELDIENEDVIRQALAAYRDGSADFADYVIAYGNERAGCEVTYSFDRKLGLVSSVVEP